jgi:AcrR family transcriptional regulator
MPQIAKRAGIAAGTIYHYFKGKEALVNALYRKWKTYVAQRVFTAFPQAASPREQFAVVWREIVDFATTHPEAYAFLELHNHTSYLDAESVAIGHQLEDFTRAMVERAQGLGLLKPLDSSLLIELVFGAFTGTMRAHWEGRIELTPDIVDGAEQACWDTIAVHD